MKVLAIGPRSIWAVMIQDVKDQCRIDGDTDNAYLQRLIERSQEDLEEECDRAFSECSFRMTMERFPDEIRVPFPPLKTVDTLKYVDQDGIEKELLAAAYDVDSDAEPAVITPVYGTCWPATRAIRRAVILTFTAGGWGDGRPLPQRYRHAILATVAHRYENREDPGFPQAVLDALPNLRLWTSYGNQ